VAGGVRAELPIPAAPAAAPGRPAMIRVVLADDQALVRAGFRALLDAEPDVDVDGVDLFGAPATGVLSCRIYATGEGVAGVPDVATLITALREFVLTDPDGNRVRFGGPMC
jgi:hypothetical protein